MSELYPDGVERLNDIPYSLHDALEHATTVLGWRENLDEDEIPPRLIWFNNEKLKDWFKEVQRKRKAKYGSEDGPGPIEDPVENDAAKMLIAG